MRDTQLVPGKQYTVKTVEQLTRDFGEPNYEGSWEKCPNVFADAMTKYCGMTVTAKSPNQIKEDAGDFIWSICMMQEHYITERGNSLI